jgi:hypothetical protein
MALVRVEGFDVSIEADGAQYEVSVDGECVTVTGDLDELGLADTPFESGQVCVDDVDELSKDGFGALEDELADEGIDLPVFGPFNQVEVGIVAVRENGQWFVSPVRTSLDLGVKGLQALNRDHLDAAVDFVESLVTSFEESFTTSFDESFTTDDEFTFDQVDEFDEFPPPSTSVPEPAAAEPLPDGSLAPFPETFEEQMAIIFGNDAECVVEGIDALDPLVAADIRAGMTGKDVLTFEASDALDGILEQCGVFTS